MTTQQILALASPFLLALLAGVGWLYRHERERRTAAEAQLDARKRQSYDELLGFFFKLMATYTSGRTLPKDQIVKTLWEANRSLLLYASDEVLRSYQQLMVRVTRGGAKLSDFGEFLLTLRRDAGLANTTLTPFEAIRQLVGDVDPSFMDVFLGELPPRLRPDPSDDQLGAGPTPARR
jgi:hypothetical protein